MAVALSVCLLSGGCGGGDEQSFTPPQQISPNVLGDPVAVPDGVDPALMSELARALESQLISQGGKGLSDVTGIFVSPLMRVDAGLDVELSWDYYNPGDYDQNGEVNIADLTQIGVHFGMTIADAGWAAASVADGDGNGEINIADITPIGAGFGSLVYNYLVEANIDGVFDWQPVGNVAFSAGVIPGGGGVMQFATSITNGGMVPGPEAALFRVSAGPVAAPLYEFPLLGWSATLAVDPPNSYPPLDAMLTVQFNDDTGPFDVVINFDDSSADYTGTSPAGGDLVFPHTFAGLGTYNVAGTVTNTGPTGGEMPISMQVEVVTFSYEHVTDPDNWTEIEMEAGEMWGKHSAVALVDGVPMIVYTRDDREEIYFARATTPRPKTSTDWIQMTIDDGDDRGGTLGIAEVQGVPCVVYEDTIGQDTYFASATSATPSLPADWVIHEVDTAESMRTQAQIASIGGVPGLVYITGTAARYAVSNVGPAVLPGHNDDWLYEDIDADGFMSFPRIAAVGDVPVVAYQRADAGWKEVRYAWRDTASWQIMTVDDLNKNSGNAIKLQLVGDPANPGVILAYQNIDIVSYLRYANCPVWNPGSGGEFTTMTVRQQAQTHVGNWLGLAWFNGRPFMSYVNTGIGSTAGLQISVAMEPAPSGPDDFAHSVLDEAVGYFINEQTSALALDDGTLFIVYRTNEGLRFAYFDGP